MSSFGWFAKTRGMMARFETGQIGPAVIGALRQEFLRKQTLKKANQVMQNARLIRPEIFLFLKIKLHSFQCR
jgi:hypothetical protein